MIRYHADGGVSLDWIVWWVGVGEEPGGWKGWENKTAGRIERRLIGVLVMAVWTRLDVGWRAAGDG